MILIQNWHKMGRNTVEGPKLKGNEEMLSPVPLYSE